MKKRIFCFFLTIFLIFTPILGTSAYEISGFEVSAKNAMVMSLDTGEVLYRKATTEKIYPASITKLMTAAVILDSLGDNIDNATVTMTKTAYQKILGTGSAVLGAKVDEVFSARDALAAVMISSAGDIVYAYCESTHGSVESFVAAMNQKAEQLGLKDTFYENPVGLHHETQVTTVEDIAALSVYVLNNYPIISEITAKPRYKMAATNMSKERLLVTTDYMIDSSTSYYYTPCKGLKTGFTDEAGRCFVGIASKNGYNYLSIVMNSPPENGTRTEFTTTKRLFEWAFNNFSFKSMLDTTKPVAEMKVELSMDYDYVPLYPETKVKAILPNEADDSSVIITPHLNAKSVNAPVKKGDILGTADVFYAEQKIGSVNLIAGTDIKSSFILVAWDKIKSFFTHPVFVAIVVLAAFWIAVLIVYIIMINRKSVKKRRKIRYIPYNEEKELRQKQIREKRRQKDRLKDYNQEDDRYE